MEWEKTPNLGLEIPSHLELPGSSDIPLNENLRKIDSAYGSILASGGIGGPGLGYILSIEASNGQYIESSQDDAVRQTVLNARVFLNGKEVTQALHDVQFIWRKRTFGKDENYQPDVAWNMYFGTNRSKTVTVYDEDVLNKATFFCDLVSL